MTLSPLRTTALIAVLAGSASLSGCVLPPAHGNAYNDSRDSYRQVGRGCQNCGTVLDIARFHGDGRASGGGAVLGAVVGGVLGNQVGSGSGRRAATVAGAVVGGVAGHRIEQRSDAAGGYELQVRLDNGRVVVLEQRDLGDIRVGDYVRIADGRASLR